ncbi:structure-specific endonuclease subunit SLX1 [Aspergillus undulatus]|uniref:structure-specific endonuclease subunit SLX1 n=1 Tax=Aspergillus undulatus TaxID=1810928 RepID=UPI003CCCC02F
MRVRAKKDGYKPDKPQVIPAYYCCYLLRSQGEGYKSRKTALYIGSTPDPARRLAQHNGLTKGGACKTADPKRRPWEMVMVVEGFTSCTAALQFEWAWQHPAATRHITSDIADKNQDSEGKENGERSNVARKAQHKPKSQKRSKSGDEDKDDGGPKKDSGKKTKKKTKPPARRTRTSLNAHLEDLHLLLRSPYFRNWPLALRFFVTDVAQNWRGWCDRVDGVIPDHIKTITDGACAGVSPNHDGRHAQVGSIRDIKVDYMPLKDYLEKAMFLLDDIRYSNCKLCQEQYKENELSVVCPRAGCTSTAHLLCLSAKFLDSTQESDRFVPHAGKCPTCLQTVEWSLMMKELSIRTRGKVKPQVMLEKCGRRDQRLSKKAQAQHAEAKSGKLRAVAAVAEETSDSDSNDTDSLDDYWDNILGSDSDSGLNDHSQQSSKVSSDELVIENSESDHEELLI